MSGNSFGSSFIVTTFGESHGVALGCIIDGCPPGLELCEDDIQKELDKTEIKLERKYTNSGFALIYDESLNKIKKLDDRSLMIYHKS